MATTYKTFLDDDIVTTKTLLHESIPMAAANLADANTKAFTHGMFQSIFDGAFADTSSNHLFDLTAGVSSTISGYSSITDKVSKSHIYNQLAQVLAGYDTDNKIKLFDTDGDATTSGDSYLSAFFVNFSRIISKDEIKKGTFSLKLNVSTNAATDRYIFIKDSDGSANYRINSPTGEYGILYASDSTGAPLSTTQTNFKVGLIFYQAGIAVISTNIFAAYHATQTTLDSNSRGILTSKTETIATSVNTSATNVATLFSGETIDEICYAFRKRIANLDVNNTTELNSTIHFCRINHNDFNYSSNPTYLSSSQIVVKGGNSSASPVTYITTVGLYSPDNELLAVAKLSQPIKKDPTQELILRVRLDY